MAEMMRIQLYVLRAKRGSRSRWDSIARYDGLDLVKTYSFGTKAVFDGGSHRLAIPHRQAVLYPGDTLLLDRDFDVAIAGEGGRKVVI
jgi:hypothetical protein